MITSHSINRYRYRAGGAALYLQRKIRQGSIVFGLNDFFAAIKTIRADMVTQVRFSRRRLGCQRFGHEKIMRTVHAALGRGLLVLLNSHETSP
jgi:hypothetical protein